MSKKGKGGKKHRRGKNISTDIKIDIPDEYQYFAYVNKILGSGRVNLDYYIPKFNENTNEIAFQSTNGEICETKVDIAASADILINNRINCKIKVSLKEYFDNSSIIQGSKGKVIINSPWLPERKTFLEISYKDRNFKQFIESDLSVYANQIKNVTNEFLNNTSKNDRLYIRYTYS